MDNKNIILGNIGKIMVFIWMFIGRVGDGNGGRGFVVELDRKEDNVAW